MVQIITVPKLGLTMEKGIITHWYVEEGDLVSQGDPLFEIQTDKLTNDVESPDDACVLKILAEKDGEYDVYSPACVLGEKGESWEIPEPGIINQESHVNEPEEEKTGAQTAKPVDAGAIKISPVARRLAEENQVDLTKVTATGPDGRITKEDITAYLEKGKPAGPAAAKGTDIVTTKQPASGMRRIIAGRMTESKRTIPHTYFKTSVDATRLIRERNDSGKRYSYNDLIIRAVAHAIGEYPVVNALFVNERIEFRNEINIGLAVEVEDGLVVPVIKNALRPLAEIAADTAALIEKAKNNKLLPDDMAGGTFTVSNLGMYAIDEFTAIINPGESAILAVGRVMERVYPADGQVKIRPEMNLTLSVDHRLIDGAVAARFLERLKDILESGLDER